MSAQTVNIASVPTARRRLSHSWNKEHLKLSETNIYMSDRHIMLLLIISKKLIQVGTKLVHFAPMFSQLP